MIPGGTDVNLLELAVGFLVAVSLIAVLTMIQRRRGARQDLPGTQVREMQARVTAAEASRDAATRIADTRSPEALSRAPTPVDALPSDEPAASLGAGTPDAAAGDRWAQDGTAAPAGSPPAPGGEHDAMADAFAWLRIAALVEAGQREQAVELLSTTMAIPADEAEMLVDGLTDAGGERRTDHGAG